MPGPLDIDQPEWGQILQAAQDQVQARIHTSIPAIVRSYDVATQTAEVQLAIQLRGENVPPLADVPVCWPGGAAGFLHVPLAAGDTVLVVFSEQDFSGFWISGSVSAPKVLARHGLHAIAIPGLRRPATALDATAGHVTLGATDELRLGSDTATDPVALEPAVSSIISDLIDAIGPVIVALGAATTPPVPTVDFVSDMIDILARLAAHEMAATKVKAV